MAKIQDYIIGVSISIFIASALVPVAFTNFYAANKTGWDASVITVWNLIPLMVIIGVVLLIIGFATSRRSGSGI